MTKYDVYHDAAASNLIEGVSSKLNHLAEQAKSSDNIPQARLLEALEIVATAAVTIGVEINTTLIGIREELTRK